MQGDWYVGPKKAIVFHIEDAFQFPAAGEALRSLAIQPQNGLLYEIEVIVQNIGPISPLPEFVMELMEKIPLTAKRYIHLFLQLECTEW